jgi:hypothetical protein
VEACYQRFSDIFQEFAHTEQMVKLLVEHGEMTCDARVQLFCTCAQAHKFMDELIEADLNAILLWRLRLMILIFRNSFSRRYQGAGDKTGGEMGNLLSDASIKGGQKS